MNSLTTKGSSYTRLDKQSTFDLKQQQQQHKAMAATAESSIDNKSRTAMVMSV
jgi:hypothetical protein